MIIKRLYMAFVVIAVLFVAGPVAGQEHATPVTANEVDIDWRLALRNALAGLFDPINLYDRWPEYGYSIDTVKDQQPCTDRSGKPMDSSRLEAVPLGEAAIVEQMEDKSFVGFVLQRGNWQLRRAAKSDQDPEFTLADLCMWIEENINDYNQNWYIVTDRYIPKLRTMADIRVSLEAQAQAGGLQDVERGGQRHQ